MLMNEDWLLRYRVVDDAACRIVALPHAGAGPAVLRPIVGLLPDHIELACVQLPGHGARLSEQPFTRSDALVKTLAPILAEATDRPYSLFGHSMGAFVAFELCRELRRIGAPLPHRLIASARRPPDYPAPEPDLHRLDDEGFLAELTRCYDGIPPVIRSEPQLMALFLPILKADFAVFETYRWYDEPPLPCHLSLYGGVDDIQTSQMDGWKRLVREQAVERRFPGGHFYLTEHPASFAAALVADAPPGAVTGCWQAAG